MTSDQFTNWLSGFIFALGSNQPTNEQFNIVKDNLEKVFNKVTPNRKEENLFERYVVPDCGLLNNDGVFSPVGDMLKKEFEDFNYEIKGTHPSGGVLLTVEDLNQFFKEYPITETRNLILNQALLENYTGPFDGEVQNLTC